MSSQLINVATAAALLMVTGLPLMHAVAQERPSDRVSPGIANEVPRAVAPEDQGRLLQGKASRGVPVTQTSPAFICPALVS